MAFGIWTRYFAFYLDISRKYEKYNYLGDNLDAYFIMKGSSDDGASLNYFMQKEE